MVFGFEIWAAIGFLLAAYAVVGNDALQTLGTFINSNRNMHWTILFAFASLILVLTFTYGWHMNGGDPSYGRLANTSKYPPIAIEWYHTIPPLVLVFITRLGIPVSTSFMVLTIFATGAGLTSMLEKSLIGYALAFTTGLLLYIVLSRTLESWFTKSDMRNGAPRGLIVGVGTAYLLISQGLLAIKNDRDAAAEAGRDPSALGDVFGGLFTDNATFLAMIGVILVIEVIANVISRQNTRNYWVTMQWVTTGYLWAVWLIQDFANIFVFLPRELTPLQGFTAMAAIVVLLAITFANNGGPVQRILRTKSNVTDIRSASVIDLTYASLLFFFKEYSDIPMSTTWVFLGLMAGRQYAFALMSQSVNLVRSVVNTAEDVAKAFVGIVISIDLAVGLPYLARLAAGDAVSFGEIFGSQAFAIFVTVANLALLPTLWFAFAKAEDANGAPAKLRWAIATIALLLVMTATFFSFREALS